MKKSSLAKALAYIVFVLSYPIMGLVLAMVAAHVLALFQDTQRLPDIVAFIKLEGRFEKAFEAFFHHFMPTRLGGRDVTAVFAGFALYGLSVGLKRASTELHALSAKWKAEEEAAGIVDRAKLLETYATAKAKLDALKRSLAFLSMDVVDSTGLKHGEDASVAERDFRRYKQMVEKCLADAGVLKSTWTPDGVMACFADAASAVRAARATIAALEEFNASVKTLRADFKIRCGVNAGPVLYDEKTPMEEMSDRVIDVAGHMQKYGTPNSVCAPTALVADLGADFAFKPADRVVDGFPVSELAVTRRSPAA